MKAFFSFLFLFFSLAALAQKIDVIEVDKKKIVLEDVHETNGGGTKRFILKMGPSTPDDFKVSFKYHYHWTSKNIDNIVLTPNGVGSVNFGSSTEYFEGTETLRFHVGESSVQDLEILVEVSKPRKNTHGIKVVTSLKEAKGNSIEGGKVFLGLLGRSYEVKAACQ